jgi:hypothetical protein
VRDLGSRCEKRHCKLGILVTLNGITGEKDKTRYNAAEQERHDFLTRSGIHILALSKEDICGETRSLFGLQGALKEDLEALLFGERH